MGLFLIVFGVLIATDTVNYIAQWMLEHVPWFSMIG
jgi:cytochrome c-type biogenesis protein